MVAVESVAYVAIVFTVAGWVKGVTGMGLPTVAMGALGLVMAGIYAAVRFSMFARFTRALDAGDLPAAAAALAQLRAWVGINLVFGLAVIAIAGFG